MSHEPSVDPPSGSTWWHYLPPVQVMAASTSDAMPAAPAAAPVPPAPAAAPAAPATQEGGTTVERVGSVAHAESFIRDGQKT